MRNVRLFAAAADAAGETETDSNAATLGALLNELRSRYGREFDGVLQQCSVMVDGRRANVAADAQLALSENATIDILPPFAGG